MTTTRIGTAAVLGDPDTAPSEVTMRQTLGPLEILVSAVCGSAVRDKEQHPGKRPHACPFKQEIHDDDATLCNCCDACTEECARDV